MSVRITNNKAQLFSERTNKVSLAIRLMLEATHRYSEPKTPKQHGNLRADIVKTVQGTHGAIVWDKNYAIPQEAGIIHGVAVKRYTTSGTGRHFAQDAAKRVATEGPMFFRQVGL